MKFVCSHCKAKYQLADEKVGGRTLRMTCRSCGQEILIRAEPTPQPSVVPAPPAALGGQAPLGARRSVASAPRMTPPPAPLGAALPRVVPPPPPSPLGAEFRAAVAPTSAPKIGPTDEWHVAIDDQPLGPIHREEVARKIAAGALGPDSLAWREGLDDWMPIHDIPELMVLCSQAGQAQAMSAAYAPSAIGGRAGAAPGFAVEDWGPVPERSAPPAAMPAGAPSEAELSALRGPRLPSMPVMFAAVCGFAFLMSLVAIFGARFLAKDARADASSAPAPIAQQAAPAQQASPKEQVIELDEQVFDEPSNGRPRGPGGARSDKSKKELTEAQKAMLARMGGEGSDLTGLSQKSAQSTGPARSGGTLTATEVSSVVNRSKKQLQRCYETALRGAGSDDTVRLDVSLTIAPSGSVSEVQVGGQGLPGMTECIERTVRTWRFPSARESVATRFPLLFQPGA